jgi:UV DNA damage endonuclease
LTLADTVVYCEQGDSMNRFGLCCISLKLKEEGIGHQTMTFKRFNSLPREEALQVLGDRIFNNLTTTRKTIEFCGQNNYVYRVSSDIFPLITYYEANVSLEDLPNHDDIQDEFDNIAQTIIDSGVRVSCHPSEYNSLASLSDKVVDKTITELNFYSSFFDRIGLPANTNSPMNLHVHNNNGTREEVANRFYTNFKRLDENCQKRLTIENDDKLNCWSVQELVDIFHPITRIPICFDYLHHKCHPNNLTEREAINMCYDTWQTRPLFHYSESREGNNPRAHSEYAYNKFETYSLEFDIDMELKGKDFAIEKYEQIINRVLV